MASDSNSLQAFQHLNKRRHQEIEDNTLPRPSHGANESILPGPSTTPDESMLPGPCHELRCTLAVTGPSRKKRKWLQSEEEELMKYFGFSKDSEGAPTIDQCHEFLTQNTKKHFYIMHFIVLNGSEFSKQSFINFKGARGGLDRDNRNQKNISSVHRLL